MEIAIRIAYLFIMLIMFIAAIVCAVGYRKNGGRKRVLACIVLLVLSISGFLLAEVGGTKMRPKPKTDNLYEAMSAILEKSEFETESKYFDFRTPVMDGHINIYKSSSKEAETNRFLESNGYRFVGTHGAVTYSASWLYTDRGYHGINLPLESGGKVWLFYEDNCVYIEYWYTKFGKQGGVSQLISPIVTPMLFFRPELNFMEIAQGDWTESDTENFLYY